ncbi:Cof-type HAD-IIB family hydrolase [Brevibacillus choshinensis]|uniref:Cof-type HAD-IIB family hydrolase n=1 Tax=Brevibacillus choshinensis TaxID=54911 RepID=UPI002E2323AF|nr:Cof-type HAD-IIB family hydrolase [Brevibacillus choshinensis]
MWCIISDLDGTLLNDQQQISARLERSIKQFVQDGGKFTFATGRSFDSTLPFIQQLDLQIPVILYNGSKIYDPVSKRYVYEQFLDPLIVENVLQDGIDLLDKHEISLLAFDYQGAHYLRWSERLHNQLQKDRISAMPTSVDALRSSKLVKLMFIGDPEKISIVKKIMQNYNPVNSEPELLEIMAQGVNKGVACNHLLQMLDIPKDCLVAVGDNENDVEMIHTARCGIAVKNAHSRLISVADYVTETTNNELALIEVIEKIRGGLLV